jgi:hypothetical protein
VEERKEVPGAALLRTPMPGQSARMTRGWECCCRAVGMAERCCSRRDTTSAKDTADMSCAQRAKRGTSPRSTRSGASGPSSRSPGPSSSGRRAALPDVTSRAPSAATEGAEATGRPAPLRPPPSTARFGGGLHPATGPSGARHVLIAAHRQDGSTLSTARTSGASASCRACPRSSCRAPGGTAPRWGRPTGRPRPCPRTPGRAP